MWGLKKQSSNTDTSDLQRENRELRKQLNQALKTFQDLSLRQQESLDRVIAKQFDQPITPSITAQPQRQFVMPQEHLADVMGIEDDRDFLETVHGA